MDWSKMLEFYWSFGIITVPLTIAVTYFSITELLDLIFNTGRINEMLKHSDSLNLSHLEQQYQADKRRQSNLNKSNLMELERQIAFKRLVGTGERKRLYNISYAMKEKVIAAKKVADIFKLN